MKNFDFLCLQTSSKAFLTKPLPDCWEDMTDEEQESFLLRNVWCGIEQHNASEIYDLIDAHARSIKTLIKGID